MTRQGALLIVDDNELNRDVLSRRLGQKGYAVTVAAGGTEALAAAARARFDLVLLDVEMPDMSGLEVLGRLRQTYTQTQLPVIMVTARTEGVDIVEAFRLGANAYVTIAHSDEVALLKNDHVVAIAATGTPGGGGQHAPVSVRVPPAVYRRGPD